MVEVFDAEGVDTAAVSAAVVHAFSQPVVDRRHGFTRPVRRHGQARLGHFARGQARAVAAAALLTKSSSLASRLPWRSFQTQSSIERKYRRLLSALRAALRLPETFMSTGRWAQLDFSRAASVCFLRNTRAFLNEGRRTLRDTAEPHRLPDDAPDCACWRAAIGCGFRARCSSHTSSWRRCSKHVKRRCRVPCARL